MSAVKTNLLLATVATLCGLGLGACFGSSCIDHATLDYSLTATNYRASTFSVGDYGVDGDDLRVQLDPTAETVTLRFEEDGRPIEVVYGIARVDTPE